MILIVRTVGRRPGKQLTPFEFVLIFYLGGLMLTAVVREEASLTTAFCQILMIGLTHYAVVLVRGRSSRIAQLLDGTPLALLEGGFWRASTMQRMRVADDDVMEMARWQWLKTSTRSIPLSSNATGRSRSFPSRMQSSELVRSAGA